MFKVNDKLPAGKVFLMKKTQQDRTIDQYYGQVWHDYWIPVLYAGEMIDFLAGTVHGHNVSFFKDGIFLDSNQHWYGRVCSINPPYEEFEIYSSGQKIKVDLANGIVMIRFKAAGNKGTRYSGTWKYNLKTESFATLIRGLPAK